MEENVGGSNGSSSNEDAMREIADSHELGLKMEHPSNQQDKIQHQKANSSSSSWDHLDMKSAFTPSFSPMPSIFASTISKANFNKDPASPNSAHLSLADDDPKAMEIMCHILHGNSLDADIREIPPNLVLGVAIPAAKYDCTLSFTAVAKHWLSSEIVDTITRSRVVHTEKKDLLLAAYWFRHKRAFEAGSLQMITETSSSFNFLADGKSGENELVAMRIAIALEQKCNEIRLSLYTRMMKHISAITYCKCNTRKPTISWKQLLRRHRNMNRVTTTATSSVLRNVDLDILSRGTPYMSISSMMRLADEKMSKTLEWNRVGQCNVSGPPLGHHKTLMKCSVSHFKKSGMMRGLCLAWLHPQMVCEDTATYGEDNERGREFREWLPAYDSDPHEAARSTVDESDGSIRPSEPADGQPSDLERDSGDSNDSVQSPLAQLLSIVASHPNPDAEADLQRLREMISTATSQVNNQNNTRKIAPLHIAAERGLIGAVEELLKAGAKLEIQNREGSTPLMTATENEREEITEKLLAPRLDDDGTVKAQLEIRDNLGRTPLLQASIAGFLGGVKFLINAGVNRNAQTSESKSTPLIAASSWGYQDVVEALLDDDISKPSSCADLNLQKVDGSTALHVGIIGGHYEIAEILLNAGVDLNMKDEGGQNALHLASEQANEKIINLLLRFKAALDEPDNNLRTLFHIAINSLRDLQSKLAMDRFGSVDLTVEEKRIAELQSAQCIDTIQLLLDHGAQPGASNSKGETALHLAAACGEPSILKAIMLKMKIKDLLHRNTDGQTALSSVLQLEGQKHGGCKSRPRSAAEMCRFIVEYCIGSYERSHHAEGQPIINNTPSTDAGSSGEQKKLSGMQELSLGQIYTRHVNRLRSKETSLSEMLSGQHLGVSRSVSTGTRVYNVIGEVSYGTYNLYSAVESARGELKILKMVTEYQEVVQRGLASTEVINAELSATYLMKNIRDLDISLDEIQSALNMRLSLWQSEVTNCSVIMSLEHGQVLMVFTFATLLFSIKLPLSFLSSLFALDVSSFLQTPDWAFVVLFLASIVISIAVAFVALYAGRFKGYFVEAWKIWKGYPSEARYRLSDEIAV
ncbi:hypothetical protein CSAL01_08823 [Colletotrichum salicis]|uniref:Uncharacterized protein n=1 Tax=Colletotrichum salicis TaxID=1209931 RepID=A0A135UYF2_9PEZI|nr:hypothetical protein CSAL01_08823 [Colletotrichum salicis]